MTVEILTIYLVMLRDKGKIISYEKSADGRVYIDMEYSDPYGKRQYVVVTLT